MTQRLIISEITSIGVVPDGDNPEAEILFYKSKPPEPVPGPVTKEESMPFDVDSLDSDGKAFVADLQSQIAALTVDDPPGLPDDLDPVTKARLDEQDAAIEKAQAETASVAKQLADELEKQATEKWADRADKLQALMGESDVMGPVFKTLDAAAPEAFATLDAQFDTLLEANSFVELLEKELGTANDGGTAADKHAAHVAKIREDDSSITLADAKKQAWEDHPDLVKANRAGG